MGQYTCSLTTTPPSRGEDQVGHPSSLLTALALKELAKIAAITFSLLHISLLGFKSQIMY